MAGDERVRGIQLAPREVVPTLRHGDVGQHTVRDHDVRDLPRALEVSQHGALERPGGVEHAGVEQRVRPVVEHLDEGRRVVRGDVERLGAPEMLDRRRHVAHAQRDRAQAGLRRRERVVVVRGQRFRPRLQQGGARASEPALSDVFVGDADERLGQSASIPRRALQPRGGVERGAGRVGEAAHAVMERQRAHRVRFGAAIARAARQTDRLVDRGTGSGRQLHREQSGTPAREVRAHVVTRIGREQRERGVEGGQSGFHRLCIGAQKRLGRRDHGVGEPVARSPCEHAGGGVARIGVAHRAAQLVHPCPGHPRVRRPVIDRSGRRVAQGAVSGGGRGEVVAEVRQRREAELGSRIAGSRAEAIRPPCASHAPRAGLHGTSRRVLHVCRKLALRWKVGRARREQDEDGRHSRDAAAGGTAVGFRRLHRPNV